MISIIVPIRNATEMAGQCLASLGYTFGSLGTQKDVQYILIDDASDPDRDIPRVMLEFRRSVPSPVKILRFKTRQHYTMACVYGFSLARGDQAILVSHDMQITPSCVRNLMAVTSRDRVLGIIRAVSAHMDGSAQEQSPPHPLNDYAQIEAYSAHIAALHGNSAVEEPILIGDCILVRRDVLEKIGVMDKRFVGFLGDMDWGLRAQRAGFTHVSAKGAWLHHEGSGLTKSDCETGRARVEEIAGLHLTMVGASLEFFRKKWHITPPADAESESLDFAALRAGPPPDGGDYEPPVAVDPAICDEL